MCTKVSHIYTKNKNFCKNEQYITVSKFRASAGIIFLKSFNQNPVFVPMTSHNYIYRSRTTVRQAIKLCNFCDY